MSFIALHLWQSTLVLIAAWVLARACERNGAAVRYCIWFAASVKFLVPFALLQWLGDYLGRTLPEPLSVDPALIETGKAIFVPAVPGFAAIPDGMLPRMQMALAVIWAIGSATLLLRWFLQWRVVRSTARSAMPLSMDVPVPVCVTSSDLTPGVFGVFRPVVILPRSVMSELNDEQLQAVLAHEACHVRRHDNLTAAIHKCVEVVFWFNPFVWWIGANLLREREAACDESVIEQGYERVVYAESILQVCRWGARSGLSESTFSGMAASTGGDLVRRMSSIMSEQRATPIGQGRFLLLLGMAMAACYVPITAGIVAGAIREASHPGPITFDAVSLKLSEPRWWHSREFDPDARRLALKDVSLRDLISLAYPSSMVNAAPDLIDRAHYDIEARWHERGVISERSVYRQLLGKILRSNSNLQVHVNYQCDMGCG